MKTMLPDGRIFETLPILSIEHNPEEPVYKYTFITTDRIIKSSSRHIWAVWNKYTNDIGMMKMSDIVIDYHELLVQNWKK